VQRAFLSISKDGGWGVVKQLVILRAAGFGHGVKKGKAGEEAVSIP
jgi:hypothetical protein